VIFELRDALALPRLRGSRIDADLVAAPKRSSEVACITVSRNAPEDVGFREVFVSVDGKDVAILRYGDTITHELAAGPHRIQAHNTLFWKTRDVVLTPGEHARFTAINRAGWGTFGFMVFLGASPVYLTFEREKDPC